MPPDSYYSRKPLIHFSFPLSFAGDKNPRSQYQREESNSDCNRQNESANEKSFGRGRRGLVPVAHDNDRIFSLFSLSAHTCIFFL